MLDLATLRSAVCYEGGITRRLFLAYGTARVQIDACVGIDTDENEISLYGSAAPRRK